jgi:hypothetical protein
MMDRNYEYDQLMESLSTYENSSPYVDCELSDDVIVLDGDFSCDDLLKIIEYKKKVEKRKQTLNVNVPLPKDMNFKYLNLNGVIYKKGENHD